MFEDTTNLSNTASKTALFATVTLFCFSLPETVVLPSLKIKFPASVILVKSFVSFNVAVPLFSKFVILLFLITAFEAVRTLLALILSAYRVPWLFISVSLFSTVFAMFKVPPFSTLNALLKPMILPLTVPSVPLIFRVYPLPTAIPSFLTPLTVPFKLCTFRFKFSFVFTPAVVPKLSFSADVMLISLVIEYVSAETAKFPVIKSFRVFGFVFKTALSTSNLLLPEIAKV